MEFSSNCYYNRFKKTSKRLRRANYLRGHIYRWKKHDEKSGVLTEKVIHEW